jgi:hypothetical protein
VKQLDYRGSIDVDGMTFAASAKLKIVIIFAVIKLYITNRSANP